MKPEKIVSILLALALLVAMTRTPASASAEARCSVYPESSAQMGQIKLLEPIGGGSIDYGITISTPQTSGIDMLFTGDEPGVLFVLNGVEHKEAASVRGKPGVLGIAVVGVYRTVTMTLLGNPDEKEQIYSLTVCHS